MPEAGIEAKPGMRALKTLSNNIKFNAISQIAAFAVNFALLPFIVSHTGAEIYGAYILVVTFTGYLGLMDLGVGGATIKYIAEFSSKGDGNKVSQILSASLTFFTAIGIISALVLFALSFCFDLFFKVDAYNKVIIRQLFQVAAVASFFIWPGRIFDYALQGFQRYDRFAGNNIIFTALIGISAYVVFANDMGIVCYLAVSSLLTVLKYFSAFLIVNGGMIKERLIFPYFNKGIIKVIFDFSLYTFISSLAGILIFNVDSIIIGSFVSVAAVTVYNVGYNMQQGLRMLNSLIGGPLFPAYVEMESRNEFERQKNILFKGTKYLGYVFVPMVMIAIVFAKPFITYWMGDAFISAVLPAQILISFWFFNIFFEVGSGMLSAKGFVKIICAFMVLNALANLVLSLTLVRFMGITGVALGTTIPMVLIYCPLIIRKVFKVFKITGAQYFHLAVKRNAAMILLAAGAATGIYGLYPPHNLLTVIFEMGIAYAISIFAGYRFLFPKGERTELRAIIGFKT